MNEDYADLFCELFDGLGLAEFRSGGEGWIADASVLGIAAEVEAEALEGALSAAAVFERVERAPGDERPRLRFALLRGLDAALAHANPLLAGATPSALAEYALRYAERGRLDSGALPGALLPRFARPGRSGQLPNDLADAFGAVVRVDAREWEACDHRTLPAHARLARPDREGGMRIAAAPMIREPDELHWEVYERGGLRFYRIHPADREPTRRRIERVIAALGRPRRDDRDRARALPLARFARVLAGGAAGARARRDEPPAPCAGRQRERRGLDASSEYRRAARREYG